MYRSDNAEYSTIRQRFPAIIKSENIIRIVNSRRALNSIRDAESLMKILQERDELPISSTFQSENNEKCEVCGEETAATADFNVLPTSNTNGKDCGLRSDRCDKSQFAHLIQYVSENLKRREWILIARCLPGITEHIIDEIIYDNQDCPRNQPYECFSRWLEMPTFNLDLLFDSLVKNKRSDIVHNLHRLMRSTASNVSSV